MTSTDSSNNQNQNNSTSETPVETSHSKAMNTTANNDSQVATANDSVDMSNMSSSEASSSPSSSSPASSSPTTSSNNTSTDKTQDKTATATDDNKPSESEQPVSTNNINKLSQKTNHSKKNHSNQKYNSIDHSPIVVPASQLPHQPFFNFYQPYVPRASGPNSLPPYTQQQFEVNGSQGPWLPHAMTAMPGDPMVMAAYMNNGQQNGAQYPTDQQHYEQFNFGFTPAFGFGYAGTGSIDYMPIQQAAQQGGSNLNPQSTQWTPSSTATTTAATATNTTNTTNPTSSPANTTTSSNDTTSSVPSTSASETSASNVKWMQVTQDPSTVVEFNAFSQQQLSPVDMYTPQLNNPHHHNANSYRTLYNRHNQMQANYHHYQYQNPYQHYPNQYNMHPMHGNGSHHYNSHKYNKYNNNNNYYTDNTGNSNYHTHDNNNNSKKSNNLNNTDSAMTMVNSKQVEVLESATSTETKSESGSKSWASIVGVSGSTSNTPPSTQQTSSGSSPAPVETTQEPQQPHVQQQQYQKKFNQYNNHGYNGEYANMRPRNNYQKSYNNNKQQSNYEQTFDLTNRSFPPINATVTKDELDEIKKSSLKKDPATTYETQTTYNPANGQHQFSQNSKKQQQYNNYQRQQQQEFNLPFGKYQQQNYHQQQNGGTVNFVFNNSNNPKFTNYNTESSSQQQSTQTSSQHTRGEKPYKGESSYFNKRHQPSQHTLSSFLNLTDKSKLDSSKPSTTTNKASVSQNETSIEQLSQQADNLQLNVDPSQQQQIQQQLTVYMNPSAYNPVEFNTSPKAARFFVIKSYSEDDIHRSIKYNIWCSTEHGNRRLDSAYFKGDGQVPVYLFFSVNGSGHFCGMAEMNSRVDYNRKTGVWTQEKWRGCFHVKWIYVKDVPNSLLRNIKLENNDNKPVTNSRDTQEIPYEKGRQVLKVFHTYNHSSSILDDFEHYERKQEEDKSSIALSIPLKDEEPSNKPTKSKSELNDNINQENQGADTNKALESTITATTNTTSNISVTSSPSTASSTSSIDESKGPSQQEVAPQQIQEVKVVSST